MPRLLPQAQRAGRPAALSYTPTGSDHMVFLWTAAAGIQNLADPGWLKSEAVGTNEAGQVAVNDFPADGSSRAMVMTTR